MLYDLVTLKKTLLQSYDLQEVERAILKLRTHIDNVKLHVPVIEQDNIDYIDGLTQYYDTILEQVSAPVEDFKKKIQEIDDKITVVSHKLFANNYELEENDGGVEHVRNHRRIHLRPEVEEMVLQRINLYTGWQYPALEIGCRDGEWTQHLVAADPLYIMDKYKEFLDSANSKFPPEYQQRLRKYPNKDYNFSALPQGQFGFIFSWGHFNYVGLDSITQVLKSVKSLLRPGGVFLFSYNDGDTPTGAGMAENFAQSYIPKSLLIPTCEGIGFNVVQAFNEEPNISWIEIRQPGELTSTKAHQVMGKIERRMP
jgi:SAM-dependent methyltransferase